MEIDQNMEYATGAEFLRHLRRLHFTLVVTSIALYVASALVPPPILSKAYSQIREIVSVAPQLTQSWITSKYAPEKKLKNFDRTFNFKDQAGKLYQIWVNSNLISDELEFYWYTLNDSNMPYVIAASEKFVKDVRSTQLPPRELSEFVKAWNLLFIGSEAVEIGKRSAWNVNGYFFEHNMGSVDAEERVIRLEYQSEHGGKPEPTNQKKYEERISAFISLKRPNSDVNPRSPQANWRFVLQDYTLNSSRSAQARKFRVEVPVSVTTMQLSLQKKFVEESGVKDWRSGRFEETFPELWQVAQHLDSVELVQLEKYVRGRLNEGQGSVEFLNVKVPYEGIRTFGILILIGIQVAFLIHLRQFFSWANSNEFHQSFPWVGVYDDIASKVMNIVTIAILPVTTVFLTATTVTDRAFVAYQFWLPTVFSIAIAIWTVIIGLKTSACVQRGR